MKCIICERDLSNLYKMCTDDNEHYYIPLSYLRVSMGDVEYYFRFHKNDGWESFGFPDIIFLKKLTQEKLLLKIKTMKLLK
jgi:hypothetical protein